MEYSASSHGTNGTSQTVWWPCKPIILSIRHLKGPKEVQLNSWWMTVSLWSVAVWQCRLILLKGKWNLFECLIWKFIHLQKIFCGRVLNSNIWYSRNSTECQMAFSNQSFCQSDILRVQLKSNLTLGERLLASDQ